MTHEEQRDEALKMLKEVLENYQYNNRKGIGMGPLSRARELLDRHGMIIQGSGSYNKQNIDHAAE
ncbi:TPA: hypothetical protein L7644_001300 [Klebsiella pneumoniae subsp. pneumoniae]|nr:hypothetical protein [Klebsiella pneumoniae subsp. pneumoniae]HBQ5925271.1 hypothetical protein [Klebsiella pneumoniae subsp. pneumoniae]HBQ5965826.1 hypothetical protein [Klebsiella pneumoniae subsp. pneumoniae]